MIHLADCDMNSNQIVRVRLGKPLAKMASLQVTHGNDGTGISRRMGHV